jgi:hypothetical protein
MLAASEAGLAIQPEHYVMNCQVNRDAVKAIRNRGTGRAPGGVVWPEHEVIYEQLRASPEELFKISAGRKVSRDDLNGNVAPEPRVAGAIHFTHAACT